MERRFLPIFITEQNKQSKQTLELALINEAHEKQGAEVRFSICCRGQWPSKKELNSQWPWESSRIKREEK